MTDPTTQPGERSRLDAVAALFAEALELEGAGAQEALLASVRARDPALADELVSLLDAHSADPLFLAEPLLAEIAGVMADQLSSTLLGSRFGTWEIDSVLHHGGMGTVYRAHRVDVDFEQHAALKVIRHGLGSPELVRRFAQERRLLARLEHPNIARLLDGGTTSEGLPYLVMEHVPGEMIDVWCAREKPSLDRLLEVFAQICSAVNFAHQNLVVHRDIKPANILVTPDGTAKLLDFGIAELERQAAAEPDAEPEHGRLLTPGYASPEQFGGGEVGTTTDTYSLGVLLYRLVTGQAPYRVDLASTPDEAAKIVAETIPPTLGAALAARGARLPRRAADLDAIVIRALKKDPADRYESVQALADDLRRYVAGAPVHARPSTLTYRAARFAGRNWKVLAAAATIVGLLIGGLSAALWQAGVAERQRDVARSEAATAAAAVTFLKTVLGSADPWRDTEQAETVDDVIRLAEAELDSVFAGGPAARAYILAALGEVAAARGQLDRADRMTSTAVAILDEAGEAGRFHASAIYLTRALALHEDGRLQEARPFAVEAVRRLEETAGNWAELAGALNQLGALEIELGDHAAAEATLRRAIALHDTNGGRELPRVPGLYNNLAVALASQPARLDEAIDAYAHATRLGERLGLSPPRLATLMVNHANVFRQLGRFEESEATYDRAIRLLTEALGPAHQSTLSAAGSLASLYEATGKFEQAAATLHIPLESARTSLPDGHPTVAYLQNVLGSALCQMDGTAAHRQGLAVSRASLDARVAALGAGHWAVASGQSVVGHCLVRLGRKEEGVALLKRAVETLRAERGEDQDLTVRAKRWLEQAE